MSSLFEDIVGQDLAVSILTRALAQGASHAYLFSGPPGVGKSDAALAFAAGLACPDAGCGDCTTCRRALEGLHPDVEMVVPEGSTILIDQIRDINSHVAYRPFEARARVYILFEAETMNTQAANAFLRTLEEPPQHVHFVLVTDAPDRMLPTIVSRCQHVPFTRTPMPLIAEHLERRYHLTRDDARLYSRASQGSLAYARELATSEEARERRQGLIVSASKLPESDLLSTERMLDQTLSAVEKKADESVGGLDARRDQALDWAGDARTRSWVNKMHDQRVKRERRRAVGLGLEEVTGTFAGWYRDMAATSVGAEDAVLNQDYLPQLRLETVPGRMPAYLEAVLAVRKTQERLRYNVDTRCAIGDMFRAIKEALI